MNAELKTKKGMEKIVLIDWLDRHNVKFNKNADVEELRQLYIKEECGR